MNSSSTPAERDRERTRRGSRETPRVSPTQIATIVTWFGVTASDRRASTRVIRIENRQLISASTGPSCDLFIRRISDHSARSRAASSTSSIPPMTSARSTARPRVRRVPAARTRPGSASAARLDGLAGDDAASRRPSRARGPGARGRSRHRREQRRDACPSSRKTSVTPR